MNFIFKSNFMSQFHNFVTYYFKACLWACFGADQQSGSSSPLLSDSELFCYISPGWVGTHVLKVRVPTAGAWVWVCRTGVGAWKVTMLELCAGMTDNRRTHTCRHTFRVLSKETQTTYAPLSISHTVNMTFASAMFMKPILTMPWVELHFCLSYC